MKTIKSPYEEMYLVTRNIYAKVLDCLDERERQSVERLNVPPEEQFEPRPSEAVLGDIAQGEMIDPQVEPADPQQEVEMQPEVAGSFQTIPAFTPKPFLPRLTYEPNPRELFRAPPESLPIQITQPSTIGRQLPMLTYQQQPDIPEMQSEIFGLPMEYEQASIKRKREGEEEEDVPLRQRFAKKPSKSVTAEPVVPGRSTGAIPKVRVTYPQPQATIRDLRVLPRWMYETESSASKSRVPRAAAAVADVPQVEPCIPGVSRNICTVKVPYEKIKPAKAVPLSRQQTPCNVCGRLLSSNYSLKRHMSGVHGIFGFDPVAERKRQGQQGKGLTITSFDTWV